MYLSFLYGVVIAMKRTLLCAALCACCYGFLFGASDSSAQIVWRDQACINQFYPAQCEFPPLLNPCAVPCRPPVPQMQAVPTAFDTACPSQRLSIGGMELSAMPYPLFRVR
jgi:hypothetical protein